MDELARLLNRVEALAGRADDAVDRRALLPEMEDALSEGYAAALAGEARLVRLEERLDVLLEPGVEQRAAELLDLLREHRALEGSVVSLRTALSRVHRDFVLLGGDRAMSR
jgi:hypothetical protein